MMIPVCRSPLNACIFPRRQVLSKGNKKKLSRYLSYLLATIVKIILLNGKQLQDTLYAYCIIEFILKIFIHLPCCFFLV